MRPDRAIYFIAATTEQDITDVFYRYQPSPDASGYDNVITLYGENEDQSQHTTTMVADYQAIVRNTDGATSESLARLIADKTREANSLQAYYGIKLTDNMDGSSDPVTFDPDDGVGGTKAAAFAVGDYILIDDEILKVTVVASPSVTASRAELGTTIATHTDNTAVYNISHDPIPGLKCNSTFAIRGALDMGDDGHNRYEHSVNYSVRLAND